LPGLAAIGFGRFHFMDSLLLAQPTKKDKTLFLQDRIGYIITRQHASLVEHYHRLGGILFKYTTPGHKN
jgi:hypothetical protein